MMAPKLKSIAIVCIISILFSPAVTFGGENWSNFKKHLKKCEIKIQGASTKQWSDMVSPKYKVFFANSGEEIEIKSSQKKSRKALYIIGAVIVLGGATYLLTKDDDDRGDVHYATDDN